MTLSLVNRIIKSYPPPTSNSPSTGLSPAQQHPCLLRKDLVLLGSKAATVPPHWLLYSFKLILFRFGVRDGESLCLTSGAEQSGWGNGVSEDLNFLQRLCDMRAERRDQREEQPEGAEEGGRTGKERNNKVHMEMLQGNPSLRMLTFKN